MFRSPKHRKKKIPAVKSGDFSFCLFFTAGKSCENFLFVLHVCEDFFDDSGLFEFGGDASEEADVGILIALVCGDEDDQADRFIVEGLVVADGVLADSDDDEGNGESGNADVGKRETFSNAGGHHFFSFPDKLAELGFIESTLCGGESDDFFESSLLGCTVEEQYAVGVEVLEKFSFHSL